VESIAVALVGLVGNIVVAGAFTFMGHAHAKERKFLINAALSGNTYEFAVRQEASREVSKPVGGHEDVLPIYPEGL